MSTETLRTPFWHGMLCAETRGEIADRMRDVLGDNYFTLVICNSYDENSDRFSSVEVNPSQRLQRRISSSDDSDNYTHISWLTDRYSLGVHTSAKTQSDGREGRPHQYVRFTFERDRFVIDHYAPAGYRLKWIFAVERHDRDD